ncbi:MAG: nucleoside deaminase [Chloroflexota bacterium]|nr:nucleoside deaminase [Chloroflexota bacterium]
MERCIELARAAAARGNHPYGSVIVMDGRIVAEGENSVVTDVDPTAHAEIVAIRSACRALGRTALSGGTIYASGEPCWTCSSAIRGARLSRVVFAAPSLWATGGYTLRFPILRVDGVAGTGSPPEVVAGILEEQARALFAELNWPPTDR